MVQIKKILDKRLDLRKTVVWTEYLMEGTWKAMTPDPKIILSDVHRAVSIHLKPKHTLQEK